ncbi:hypothetical protein BLOT_016530 [Blomia tropicalis]|nr:hypothetical protein BLOT_016530 [Blomia tropicalis]
MALNFDESPNRHNLSIIKESSFRNNYISVSVNQPSSTLETIDEHCIKFEENVDDSSEDEVHSAEIENESSQNRIRVYLRVRPVDTIAKNYEFSTDTLWVENISKKTHSLNENFNYFKFNKIFRDSSEQWPIFETCALPLISDFVIGNNSLLFTYGITSSGKSFTIRGTSERPGIIPHSLAVLFHVLQNNIVTNSPIPKFCPIEFCKPKLLNEHDQKTMEKYRKDVFQSVSKHLELNSFSKFNEELMENHSVSIETVFEAFQQEAGPENVSNVICQIWLSYYEIYNDKLYDLLESAGTNVKPNNLPGRRESGVKISINTNNQHFVHGLKQIYVTSPMEAFSVFLYGQERLKKHMSETKLNSNSSRSHSTFNIALVRIEGKNATISNIAFCDLAGKERIKKTEATGTRVVEANKINQSLMYLGQCLASVRTSQYSKSSFTNYRSTKLTQVFQPYISGTCGRTSIIYNLNPSSYLFDESYYSLDFCQIAKDIRQESATLRLKNFIKIGKSPKQLLDDDEHIGRDSIKQMKDNLEMFQTQVQSGNHNYGELIEQLNDRIRELENELLVQERQLKQKNYDEQELMAEQYKKFDKIKEIQIQQYRDLMSHRIDDMAMKAQKIEAELNKRNEANELKVFERDEIISQLELKIETMSQQLQQIDKLEKRNEQLSEQIEELGKKEKQQQIDYEQLQQQKDEEINQIKIQLVSHKIMVDKLEKQNEQLREQIEELSKKENVAKKRVRKRNDLSEDSIELIHSVTKRKMIQDNTTCPSIFDSNMKSTKKQLFSALKNRDSNPINSPSDLAESVQAADAPRTRYNTRYRRKLFN